MNQPGEGKQLDRLRGVVRSTSHEATFNGEAVTLAYVSVPGTGNDRGVNTLYITYDDDREFELPNHLVICVTETSEESHTYKITRVVNGMSATPSVEWKLGIDAATNLPPQFAEDSRISPSFPFFKDSLDAALSKDSSAPQYFYVIISTHSGKRYAENFYENTVRPLLHIGGKQEQPHKKIVTVSDDSINSFAHQTLLPCANQGAEQTVLLLSGDGGVLDILNALISSHRSPTYQPPSLGLIPMGTGNALAFSTNLTTDRTLGLRRFYQGHPHRLPTFTATFSPGSIFLTNEGRSTAPLPTTSRGDRVIHGAVVCSWALHAAIVADSDTAEYRKHGNQRFTMAAAELLHPSDGSPAHLYRGRVSYTPAATTTTTTNNPSGTAQNEPPAKTMATGGDLHSYVLATLVSHLEPGFHISPHSAPLDGQLRLLRAGPMTGDEIMGVMGRAFGDGSHVNDAAVEYESVRSLRIEMLEEEDRWRRVCVDGKIVLVPQGGWLEVRRNEPGGEEDVLNIIA